MPFKNFLFEDVCFSFVHLGLLLRRLRWGIDLPVTPADEPVEQLLPLGFLFLLLEIAVIGLLLFDHLLDVKQLLHIFLVEAGIHKLLKAVVHKVSVSILKNQ